LKALAMVTGSLRQLNDATRVSSSLAGRLAVQEVEGVPDKQDDRPPLHGLILHGMLGQGKNLRTFSRHLAAALARTTSRRWRILLPDLRNHGATASRPGFHAPHTIQSAAGDVMSLLSRERDERGLKFSFLAGHSLGGKVAMEVLQLLKDAECAGADEAAVEAARALRPPSFWLLDSIPGRVDRDLSPRGVDQVLRIVQDIPMPVGSRKELHATLTQRMGLSEDLAAWLGSSLEVVPGTGALRFEFDVAGAAAMYASYRSSEYWDVLALPPQGVDVHVVRGELSDRWTQHDWETLGRVAAESRRSAARGFTHVHVLPKARHWVHIDNQDGLVRIMHDTLAPLAEEH